MQNMAVPTYGNDPQPAREPEVLCELRRVAEISETMEKQVAELEARLFSVLAQRNDGSASDTKAPAPVRVLLAQTLHERYLHLSATSTALQSIIARLEI